MEYIAYALALGTYGITCGMAGGTLLKFISYGIFKALSLVNINKR